MEIPHRVKRYGGLFVGLALLLVIGYGMYQLNSALPGIVILLFGAIGLVDSVYEAAFVQSPLRWSIWAWLHLVISISLAATGGARLANSMRLQDSMTKLRTTR
jgi:hypothetical protein